MINATISFIYSFTFILFYFQFLMLEAIIVHILSCAYVPRNNSTLRTQRSYKMLP